MTENVFGFIILLIAHAAAGIYSSTLKYSKKTTFTIWGAWVLIQSALLVVAELLTDTMLQFLIGFVLSLVGQYVIFFVTTKGRILHRIFIIYRHNRSTNKNEHYNRRVIKACNSYGKYR